MSPGVSRTQSPTSADFFVRPLLPKDVAEGARECLRKVPNEPQLVLGVEVVRDKRSIMGYQPDGARACFFKIYVALPTQIPALKKLAKEAALIAADLGWPRRVRTRTS